MLMCVICCNFVLLWFDLFRDYFRCLYEEEEEEEMGRRMSCIYI
ncbi:hypothetical protein HanHA300_Chr05g0174901 [Helianthus annuus]|nr:hypothetical protein HanHA300_Chr05g0174901 [Helianthus annuus]KAJ0576912.1 hypothetical protein HanIR_Chr05g0229881 [Helianthus annuus]KAJ0747112.1 hypothetical protein HanOQP8_Chr05g0185741 [Helianthus annuus]